MCWLVFLALFLLFFSITRLSVSYMYALEIEAGFCLYFTKTITPRTITQCTTFSGSHELHYVFLDRLGLKFVPHVTRFGALASGQCIVLVERQSPSNLI